MITRATSSQTAVLLAAVGLVALSGCSDGDDDGERIRSYDVRLEAQDDGSVRVTETIAYDFGGEERHGIDRRIPQRLPYEQTRDRITEITDVEVTSPTGAPVDVERDDDGGNAELRIGDEDVEVSGEQTYVVAFTADAVAERGADGPRVRWTAVGTGWEVPVDEASVTVSGAGAADLTCELGGGDGCTVDGLSATASGVDDRGLVVTFDVADGVATDPVLRGSFSPARAFSVGPVQLVVALALLASVLVPVVLRVRRGRADVTITGPVTEPPQGLRPAQLGTVLDGRADLHEVTATIMDLAARGVVRIAEADVDGAGTDVEREPGAPPTNWRVTRVAKGAPDDLLPYEREVLQTLFGTSLRKGESVLMSTVHADRRTGLAQVRAAMHRDALDNGWFTDDPARVRQRWYLGGAGVLVAGLAATPVLAGFTTFAWSGVALALAGLAVLVLAHWMPVRTDAGARLLAETRAYREHLTSATPDADLLDRHLPHAVALQVTAAWKDVLSADDAPAAPAWYVTTQPGSPAVWPWLFVLSTDGGAPASSGSSSGTTSVPGGGGGGSW